MATDLVTASQASERLGKSKAFFAGRAKRGATLPQPTAKVGRTVFYEWSNVETWWETAKQEKRVYGKRSNVPEGAKSRASLVLTDSEWGLFTKARDASDEPTTVDFVRSLVIKGVTSPQAAPPKQPPAKK